MARWLLTYGSPDPKTNRANPYPAGEHFPISRSFDRYP